MPPSRPQDTAAWSDDEKNEIPVVGVIATGPESTLVNRPSGGSSRCSDSDSSVYAVWTK